MSGNFVGGTNGAFSQFQVFNPIPVWQTFVLNNTANGLQVQWYGQTQGSPPSSITGDLFSGTGTSKTHLATSTLPLSSISGNLGWQSPFTFSGSFPAGTYELDISTSGGDINNGFLVSFESSYIYEAEAVYNPLSNPAASGSGGSSVLWVKDGSGNTLKVYPFQQVIFSGNFPQTFVAPSNFTLASLIMWISDKHWNPSTATVTVTDQQSGASVSGTLSQAIFRGTQGLLPVNLNPTLSVVQGHTYRIDESDDSSTTVPWDTLFRGVQVDPPSAGFQGQAQYLDFAVPCCSWIPMHLDCNNSTTGGLDRIGGGVEGAISFVPSQSATLTGFHLLMGQFGGGGTYSSGSSLIASLYSDSGGNGPASPIQSVTVPSQNVPQNGFLDMTNAFNASISAGTKYWMVLTSPASSQTFLLARLVSPWQPYQVLRFPISMTGQQVWDNPTEGPTTWSFHLDVSSGEAIGIFIDDIPNVAVGNGSVFEQPFIAPQTFKMNFLSAEIDTRSTVYNATVRVDVLDSGGSVLGGGDFPQAEFTWGGNGYTPMDAEIQLNQGSRYSLRFTCGPNMPSFEMRTDIYSKLPSDWTSGLDATLNGTSIASSYPGAVAAVIPFSLGNSTGAPTGDGGGPRPTTLTVSAALA